MFLDHRFGAALLGDVGPQRDEAQVRDRHAAHRQHAAIGAHALDVVGLKGARRSHARGDQCLHVTFTVLATFGIEAHEGFEGRADLDQRFGEVEQAQQCLVPGHQLGGGIEHRNGLVEQVQSCHQEVITPALLGR